MQIVGVVMGNWEDRASTWDKETNGNSALIECSWMVCML